MFSAEGGIGFYAFLESLPATEMCTKVRAGGLGNFEASCLRVHADLMREVSISNRGKEGLQ